MSIDQKQAALEIKNAIDRLEMAVASVKLPASLELMGLMCIINRRLGALMAQLQRRQGEEKQGPVPDAGS